MDEIVSGGARCGLKRDVCSTQKVDTTTAGIGISDLVGHESRKTQIKIRKRRGNVKSRSTCQRGEKSDSKDTLRADPVDCNA